jgi:ribonuclease J
MNQNNKTHYPSGNKIAPPAVSAKVRGASMRAQRRNIDDANKIVAQYADASSKKRTPANIIANKTQKLKLTFLGGLEDVGDKNMAVIEYGNDAIILDCGNRLGIDLPGVNYEINDATYLETIKHKLKAYVITHGHLDHIGGLRHIVPKFPAPIYGSRYTIGVVERTFVEEQTGFQPELIVANVDQHERLKVGAFFVEFIRVTHSIPDPTAICVDTPVGRIVATGDFRLDPEPLDNLPSDIARLKQLGDEGVLALLSESSYSDAEGRTPTEHTLQKSFHDVISQAQGRIFVAVFSSNINRTQMILNAAVAAGRHIVLDGRSMLGYVEIAVRQGILKVPKGAILSMEQASTVPDDELLVMCTGGQGEPNAALQRMSEGEHKYINLKAGDTVVISSTPIPGNEIRYDQIGSRLSQAGVTLFRHPTHELDGCGPLHVSGHARRDELREMIQLLRPKFFIPVHGGHLRRRYHADLAVGEGVPRKNMFLLANGDCLYLTSDTAEAGGKVPRGSLLVDQTGNVVSGLVVKDRLMLSEAGIVTAILTIDRKSGQLLTSPDIISRGFIAMRESEELMSLFRSELRRAVQQRFKRVELDRFKSEMRDFITHFLYEQTGRSPIVIPVVNVIGSVMVQTKARVELTDERPSTKGKLAADQKRFQEMRARLLG